jgi:hypothetical protein
LLFAHVHKSRVRALEKNGDGVGWSGTLFGQDDVGFAGARAVFHTHVFAVKQDYDVGVLLE